MFVNTCEVDEMVRYFVRDPVLGPAAKYLADFRDIINDNSDGWAYWSYGTKCSRDLSEMLRIAMSRQYHHLRKDDYVAPTREDVVRACKKIETFLKTEPQLQGRDFTVPVLADAVQLSLL